MGKVVFIIDGLNLYHALDYFETGSDHDRYKKYKWINLKKLALLFADKRDAVEDVLYFTTLVTWDPGKVARHRLFIRAQENEGVSVVYGEFKRKHKHCTACGKNFLTFEEKQTDVNIALKLFQYAIEGRYDKALIISGDTDLIPAIKAVHSTFPGKQIGVVIPIGRASEDMKKQADFHHKMREHHLASCRLPDPFALKDGTVLHCPPNWK